MYNEKNYNTLFSYFKYMGSRTAPPCEEYTVYFVVRRVLPIGSTALALLKKGLEYPEEQQSL